MRISSQYTLHPCYRWLNIKKQPRIILMGKDKEERKVLGNQSGAALIVTLLVVIILTLTVTEFLFATWVEWSMAADFRDDMRAMAAARAGIDAGRVLIIEDLKQDASVDHLGEFWAQPLPIPFGDNLIWLEIKDESAKLDLNMLVDFNPDTVNEKLFFSFKRLLFILDLDESIADAVVDWTDKNDSGQSEYGYYYSLEPPYPCKNAKLDSLEELNRIRFVTPEAFARLKPFVTIGTKSQLININTAPKEIIMALHDDITESMANSLIEARQLAPFKNKGEIKDISGFSEIRIDIDPLLKITTNSFSIVSTATVGEVTRTATAMYTERNNSGATPVYYRIH